MISVIVECLDCHYRTMIMKFNKDKDRCKKCDGKLEVIAKSNDW